MWRQVHRWQGVVLGLLLVFLSVTGSILSVDPILQRFDRNVHDLEGFTVADVLKLSARKNPYFEIDRIRVDFSGRVLLRGADAAGSREVPFNPRNGRLARKDRPRPVMGLVNNLHRNLALGPTGRPITLVAVIIMLGLVISGAFLLARRLGGFSHLLRPVKGRGVDKWHSWLGRLLLIPLLVTLVSGTWMSLVSNGLLPSGVDDGPSYPETLIEAEPVPADELAVFSSIKLSDLSELNFPIWSDWWDVYVLRQDGQLSFIDRQSGAVLSQASAPFMSRSLDLFTLLHTGQGASVWGAIAGLVSLSVPFFTFTGVLIWLRRRHPKLRGTVAPEKAQVVILVGSETGTTWGFGLHLAQRLRDAGKAVHLGAMNQTYQMPDDATLLVLVATYGDGTAPLGASQFIDRLPGYQGAKQFAVLGFGDKAFPAYCAFAIACQHALQASGRQCLLKMADVNRRSAQSFTGWGHQLGVAIGLHQLLLDYTPPRPRTRHLVLVEREDFTGYDGTASAILRFKAPEKRRLPGFQAGDLLGVVPPQDPVARLYSLASSKGEAMAELCVASVESGVCSNYLLGLELGQRIDAYVEHNPDFRPARSAPTIMIGAGTGIAPFAGMIRKNSKQPMELFFGLRHADHDFYYRDAIMQWCSDGRLSGFHPAFSRHQDCAYVQDKLRAAEDVIAQLLHQGATVMVCGSSRMASAVAQEIDIISANIGLSLNELRSCGRYLEDIY
ncbi:PepSY domain-containing protein [Neptunomonas japonica]|uniref:PepSY domain-containing protein n=1 Tax=Neptunomonas japonica TaxID=417574 RepID=UPI0004191FCD|nr:PepSY domain-containing protein [Neptunomonas japonica]